MTIYRRPDALPDALRHIGQTPHTIMAGATDLFPADAHQRAWGQDTWTAPSSRPVLDLSNVDGLGE